MKSENRESYSRYGVPFTLLAALTGIAIFVSSIRPKNGMVPVDTRLRSGLHVSFVVIAPTSTPSARFTLLVDSARNALRDRVVSANHTYSTVGISDDWNVASAFSKVNMMGPFDEVVVGRNWLNTGIEQYVTRLNGLPVVPQVLVVARQIEADSVPFKYGEFRTLARVLGSVELEKWTSARFPVASFEQK